MKIEIAVPVLNEERELEPSILKMLSRLEGEEFYKRHDWKLIIADNGSSDGTSGIAAGLASRFPVRVGFVRVERAGVGLALKTCWGASRADIIGYFDLDIATDLRHVRQAVEAVELGCDLVYGTRLHRDSRVYGRSLWRETTSRVFNLLLRTYLGAKFSDGQCGFKFLKRSVYETLLGAGAQSDGWFFATELLMAAQRAGLRMCELPVDWTDSSDSRVNVIPLSLEYLKAMRALKRRVPAGKSRCPTANSGRGGYRSR
ncbi:MAG: glycosyltransferase [Elusimicrobiales bacterium]